MKFTPKSHLNWCQIRWISRMFALEPAEMHTFVHCKSNQQPFKWNNQKQPLSCGLYTFPQFPSSSYDIENMPAKSINTWLTQVQRCKSYFPKYKHNTYITMRYMHECGIFALFPCTDIVQKRVSTNRGIRLVRSVWNHACNTRAMSCTEIFFFLLYEGTTKHLYLPILFAYINDINLVQLWKGNYLCM